MYKYFTGDCHGDFRKFSNFDFPQDATVDNCFIFICGDFGGLFDYKKGREGSIKPTKKESDNLDLLASYPCTFIVVPGNHENYDLVESNFPIEEAYGGLVRKLRPNILWVERGEILTIDGETYWCFGGAPSHDKAYRIAWEMTDHHKYWWEREVATKLEMQHGCDTLIDHGDVVDYIVTHEVPLSVEETLYGLSRVEKNTMSQYFNIIHATTKYKFWFAGHHHLDGKVAGIWILYNKILPIEFFTKD